MSSHRSSGGRSREWQRDAFAACDHIHQPGFGSVGEFHRPTALAPFPLPSGFAQMIRLKSLRRLIGWSGLGASTAAGAAVDIPLQSGSTHRPVSYTHLTLPTI